MINHADYATSLGTYVFWPAFGIGAVLILAGLIAAAAAREPVFAWLAVAGAAVAGVAVLKYWPAFDPSYHRWYPVQGVVADAPTSRLIRDGDKISQRFAVRFEGNPQLFGCDDTRCSSVRPGDVLLLRCKRQWQYQGAPGWVCVYDQP